MKKIRVAHHVGQLGLGGTEKEIQILCKYLDQEKFETHVFAPRFPIPAARKIKDFLGAFLGSVHCKRRWEQNKYALCRAEAFNKILGPKNLHLYRAGNFKALLRAVAPDILHVHHSGEFVSPLNSVEILKSVPLLFTMNVFGIQDRTPCQQAPHKILFPSHWLKESCSWAHGDSRCDVLYCPIEKPLTQENMRQELNIGENIFVVGRIGRNADDIHDSISLKAYREIESSSTLFLAVSPPPKMVEEALSLGIKRIQTLEPTVDDTTLSKFYNTIDVLAHARKDGETFGCVIAEAMIHGKPVVSHYSDERNAQAELLREESGFVVERNDWKSYAAHLRALQNNKELRLAMGERAKKRALENFEASVVTRRLESFYLEI